MATILVADDELVLLDVVAAVLTEEGHAVLTATNGIVARDLLTETVPDLLITDTMMPRLDGPSLIRWVRTQPAMHQVAVVLTSAAVCPALDGLGPVRFIAKPFDLAHLLQVVAEALGTVTNTLS
jgi:CheY-like chemotaxis protein